MRSDICSKSKLKYLSQACAAKEQQLPPMKAFTYWEGDVPVSVRDCISSWSKLKKFEVVFLDDTNVSTYLNVSLPRNFWLHKVTTRSDVVRLALLAQHGGLWMDASTFINGPLLFLDEHPSKLFMFRDTFPGTWVYLHNWFIYSPRPNHPLVDAWLSEFVSWMSAPYEFDHPCTPNPDYTMSYEVLCRLKRTNKSFAKMIASDVVIGNPDGMFYNPFLPLYMNGKDRYAHLVKFTHGDRAKYWRAYPVSNILVLVAVALAAVLLYSLGRWLQRHRRRWLRLLTSHVPQEGRECEACGVSAESVHVR